MFPACVLMIIENIFSYLFLGAVTAVNAIPVAGSYGGYDVVDAYPPTRRKGNSDLIGVISATESNRSSVDTDNYHNTDVQLM